MGVPFFLAPPPVLARVWTLHQRLPVITHPPPLCLGQVGRPSGCCLFSIKSRCSNSIEKIKINIHPPSGWFFTCGQSPPFFAMRKRIYTNCQLRGDCYLLPVNGPLSLIVSCSPNISSLSWLLIYSAIRLSFFPTVST